MLGSASRRRRPEPPVWRSRRTRGSWPAAARLRDGAEIELRPIRPEDEPLLHDLVAHMTPEDLRRRFLAPIRALSHQLAARLTQIDYDREMALVATESRHRARRRALFRRSRPPAGRIRGRGAQRLEGPRRRLCADAAADRDRPAIRDRRAGRRCVARERADAGDVPRTRLRDPRRPARRRADAGPQDRSANAGSPIGATGRRREARTHRTIRRPRRLLSIGRESSRIPSPARLSPGRREKRWRGRPPANPQRDRCR